tara:strand:- start:502 stop:2721 length:2220 start_codon:yes stop_codon:yes gene_type:complete
MSEIYSIVFINPGEVDAISDDKVLPPAYRTVQNKQPIPAGSIYKRNALPNTSFPTPVYITGIQAQLISPVDIKGTGSVEVAIGAAATPTVTFYKYDAGTSSWFWLTLPFTDTTVLTNGTIDSSQEFINVDVSHGVTENNMIKINSEQMYVIDHEASPTQLQVKRGVNGTDAVSHLDNQALYKADILKNDVTSGIYYVTNALSSSNVNHLVTVKYNPSTTRAIDPCCFYFSNGYGVGKFDAFGDVDVRTLNWRSAACVASHQSKMWVGGLNEHDYSTFVDSGKNLNTAATVTQLYVYMETGHGIVANDIIKINSLAAGTGSDEEMYVTGVQAHGGDDDQQVDVIRGVNGTVATAHEDATDVYKSSGVASLKRNRVRWSKSFLWDDDISSWTGSGTGFFDFPVVGQVPTVVGLQSFKNRLYVLTNSDLYVISGGTSASFAKNEVMKTPGAIGPTLKISDRFMFWVDAVGIHQFNGVEAVNVSEKLKPRAFQSLSVDKYNIDGTLGEGRLPTAFVNDKLGIYGVHFPKTSNCSGQVTWLFYYLRGTIETYTYDYVGYNAGGYNAGMEDITYVSDYHPSGKVWMGGGNLGTPTSLCWGGLYSFEPVELGANAEKDWAGTNGISTVIDTGDINLSAIKGGSYEDTSQISHIDIFYVPDVAQDVTLKMDLSIDGAAFNDSVTRTTATLFKDPNGKLAPVKVTMPLPSRRSGAFIRIKLTEDDNDGKVDIRRMDIYYKSSMERVAR